MLFLLLFYVFCCLIDLIAMYIYVVLMFLRMDTSSLLQVQ